MSLVMAVAGKGGTGKTTVAALLIRHLKSQGLGPILAVDADPNANLAEALGLSAKKTLGSIREEFLGSQSQMPPGMTKETFLEMKLHENLVEAKGLDLLVMGRPEGPGCYCYANHILRRHMDILMKNYPFVVMDNEAGMEHLSRRTTQGVDHLFVLSDYSIKGIRTAGKIRTLIEELKLSIRQSHLIIDRAPRELEEDFCREIERQKIPLRGRIPQDPLIFEFDLRGESLLHLPEDSIAVQAVAAIMRNVLPTAKLAGEGAGVGNLGGAMT